MNGYIKRLIKCGVPVDKAVSTYYDYVNNFTIAELEVYVRYVEEHCDVDLL